jgi:hypothetical protein
MDKMEQAALQVSDQKKLDDLRRIRGAINWEESPWLEAKVGVPLISSANC